MLLFLSLTPLWCVVSHRNKYVHEVLYEGWTPVVGAMVISRYYHPLSVIFYIALSIFHHVVGIFLVLVA